MQTSEAVSEANNNLFMLDLSELITLFGRVNKRFALAVMFNDETRGTKEVKAVRLGFSENDSPALIADELRKQCFVQQFKDVVKTWPSGEAERTGREIVLRGSSACIGFMVADTTACYFFGDKSEWEVLVDTIQEKIKKLSPRFGVLT